MPAFALRQYDLIDVRPVFDNTGNDADKASFTAGLRLAARRAANRRRAGRRHYPILRMSPTEYVDSDPRVYELGSQERIDCEFIQLVDLLLGSYRVALVGADRGKHGKVQLASDATEAMAAYWMSPSHRFAQRARSMTVTVWPDAYGLPYNPQVRRAYEQGTRQLLWRLDSPKPATS